MSEYRQTLLASVGGQPQVVTFTLDLLLRQGIQVSEVFLLHPSPSDVRVQHTLHCLRTEFANNQYTCDGRTISCTLHLQTLSHEKVPLPDVTNTSDAQAIRDEIHRLLRQLKQQQRHIHLSASGGRRVISLMAISAALLHFDDFDRIWHIYTPRHLRAQVNEGAQMHVPPDAGVRLIEVPFVPWGAYFPLLSHADASAQATQRAQMAMLDAQEKARCAEMLTHLTQTQLRVLRLISTGLTPGAIAVQLNVSRDTVYSHTKALLSVARHVWHIPEQERIAFPFLFRKFIGYFRQDE